MNDFREDYRQAVRELPKLHMKSECVQDEIHHRKIQQKRRNRNVAKGCTAAAVLLLFGAGTVAAKGYMNAVIEVRDSGYTVTGGENLETTLAARSGNEEAGISESREYEDFQDFLEHSSVINKIPDISFLEPEVEGACVSVIDDSMMTSVMVIAEGKYFSLMQNDYRGVESYSSATGYTGRTENESSYINAQGLSYTLFDTVDDDGQVEATHAVIAVEGRELSMSFHGFEAETIEKILADLDLTVYFAE